MKISIDASAIDQFMSDVADIVATLPNMTNAIRDHLIGCGGVLVETVLDYDSQAPNLVVVLVPSGAALQAVRFVMGKYGHKHQPRWTSLRAWWEPTGPGRKLAANA